MDASDQKNTIKPLIAGTGYTSADRILRKDGFYLSFPFLGVAGSVAANYDQVWTCRHPMEIMRVSAVWSVASSSGTLQLEKLTGTQAPGAGVALLATTISTAGAANTVVTRELQALTASRQLKEGERLAFIDAGTLTSLAGLHITLYCKFLGRGDYR